MSKSKVAKVKGKKIFSDFEKLSKGRRKEVADFIAYLKTKEEVESTKEERQVS